MESGSVVGIGAGGGLIGILVIGFLKYCWRKQLHSKCKSGCCETSVDVDDKSPTAVHAVPPEEKHDIEKVEMKL
jgi:hypothetical protein